MNSLINKVHSVFKDLRKYTAEFYGSDDQTLIRFQFSERQDEYLFRIRFGPTFKTLKFYVKKDENAADVAWVQLEKTNDIILDIDEIYRVRFSSTVSRDAPDFKETLIRLWHWGLKLNQNRKDSVYRAPAVEMSSAKMETNILYYGVIKAVSEPRDTEIPNIKEVDVTLTNAPEIRTLEAASSWINNIKVDHLLVMNNIGRYNIFSLTAARHHLQFTHVDLQRIKAYLDERDASEQ